jgi:hypothetical protein
VDVRAGAVRVLRCGVRHDRHISVHRGVSPGSQHHAFTSSDTNCHGERHASPANCRQQEAQDNASQRRVHRSITAGTSSRASLLVFTSIFTNDASRFSDALTLTAAIHFTSTSADDHGHLLIVSNSGANRDNHSDADITVRIADITVRIADVFVHTANVAIRIANTAGFFNINVANFRATHNDAWWADVGDRKPDSSGELDSIAFTITGCAYNTRGITIMKAASVIAASAIAVITAGCATTSSTTAAVKSPASHAPASPGVGSSFSERDSDGNAYQVKLVSVISSPAVMGGEPAAGKRVVAIVIRVTGVSGTASGNASGDLTVTGGNSQVYQSSHDIIVGYTNFNSGDFSVTPGSSQLGAVTFELPVKVNIASASWQSGLVSAPSIWEIAKR